MTRFVKNYWGILSNWQLWFGLPSIVIWLVSMSSVKSWSDWWRVPATIAFLAFIGLMASIQITVMQRRRERDIINHIEALAAGESVPFVKDIEEIRRAQSQQGDDDGEHEVGPQGAGLR